MVADIKRIYLSTMPEKSISIILASELDLANYRTFIPARSPALCGPQLPHYRLCLRVFPQLRGGGVTAEPKENVKKMQSTENDARRPVLDLLLAKGNTPRWVINRLAGWEKIATIKFRSNRCNESI